VLYTSKTLKEIPTTKFQAPKRPVLDTEPNYKNEKSKTSRARHGIKLQSSNAPEVFKRPNSKIRVMQNLKRHKIPRTELQEMPCFTRSNALNGIIRKVIALC
jgi:hypothetical protein